MLDQLVLDQLAMRNKALDQLIKIKEANNPDYNKGRWVTNEEGLLLQSMVRLFNISLVVESGTANGFSACYLASASENMIVHTFDPVDRPKVWGDLDLRDRIVFHNKKFSAGAKGVLNKAVGSCLIFIDGDHSVGSVREDWDAIVKELDDGDVVVFHDMRERAIGKHWMRMKAEVGEDHHRFVVLDTQRSMGVVLWNVTDY